MAEQTPWQQVQPFFHHPGKQTQAEAWRLVAAARV